MSITRAFTTRRVKQSLEAAEEARMQRSNTLKSGPGSVRYKISAPVELIHTTNMLSYNAPDIFPRTASATSATSTSSKSDDESDTHTNASTPPTSPDVPSAPERMVAEGIHLSSYFTASSAKAIEKASLAKTEIPPVPAIPQRAPSHTSKPSDLPAWNRANPARLSEQSNRSASTKASSTFSRSSSTSTSTSITSRSSAMTGHAPKMSTSSVSVPPTPTIPPSAQLHQHRKDVSDFQPHPFGQELAQVTELAEELLSSSKANVRAALKVIEEEEQELLSRGLHKFSADDYLSEIKGLASAIFGDVRPMAAMWI